MKQFTLACLLFVGVVSVWGFRHAEAAAVAHAAGESEGEVGLEDYKDLEKSYAPGVPAPFNRVKRDCPSTVKASFLSKFVISHIIWKPNCTQVQLLHSLPQCSGPADCATCEGKPNCCKPMLVAGTCQAACTSGTFLI